jgi:methylmalonyl-CoA mutase N-terminal domain/subunit
VVVGVNKYVETTQDSVPVQRIDPKVEQEQTARVQAFRSARDTIRAQQSLATLEAAAKGDGDVMAPIVECIRSNSTLGEISDVLRGVFGEFHGV